LENVREEAVGEFIVNVLRVGHKNFSSLTGNPASIEWP
jgi:hypothetical protein